MSFFAKLFSFEGRIGRFDWWMLNLLIGAVMIGGWVVAFTMLGAPPGAEAVDAYGKPLGPPDAPDFGRLLTAAVVPVLLTLWPSYAVQVKRWHDRDKSAVWIAVNFIPWVGPIWATVELGFLPGTPGGNRFGPGPGLSADRAAAIFDEAEQNAGGGWADEAIARWQAEQQRAAPAPALSYGGAQPAGGGFGRRGLSPAR